MMKLYISIFCCMFSITSYANSLIIAFELSSTLQTIDRQISESEQPNPFQDLFHEESVQREHIFEENLNNFNNLTYQPDALLFHTIKEIKELILHALDIQNKNDRNADKEVLESIKKLNRLLFLPESEQTGMIIKPLFKNTHKQMIDTILTLIAILWSHLSIPDDRKIALNFPQGAATKDSWAFFTAEAQFDFSFKTIPNIVFRKFLNITTIEAKKAFMQILQNNLNTFSP